MLRSLVGSEMCIRDRVMPFLKFHEDDLPNPKAIDDELCLWEKYWVLNKEKCPSNVESTMSSLPPSNILSAMTAIHFPGFENIKVVLRILATLPITSCECERSFSSMRRLKNYTRTTMSQSRFHSLALLYLHPQIIPDTTQVINKFLGKKIEDG